MDGAGSGGDQQGPAAVLAKQSGDGGAADLAHGIVGESRRIQGFLGADQDLAEQRILRIAWRHPGCEPSRDEQRKTVVDEVRRRRQAEKGEQISGPAERLAEFILPGWHAGSLRLPAGGGIAIRLR
ncbi:hypothetical protein LBMAG53_12660 [Planctomycetota bacterium]|nr:hypothetical protein LBMAG53_12660 [Planctomycetota bacterium]